MTSVNVLIAEHDGSARYRLQWPAEVLKAQGADVEIHEFGEEMRDADVFVLNRPIWTMQRQVIEGLIDKGKRVIVDMDDDFEHLVPEHVLYNKLDTTNMLASLKAATKVTVTTPALLDTYGSGHGTVIKNYIPEWYLDIRRPKEHDNVWLGWYGTVTTHPNDLQEAKGGIARALADCPNGEMAYIGPKEQKKLIKFATQWNGPLRCTGWFNDPKLLMEAIACFDIGVVPLQWCKFNMAKSRLKGLEMASVGVPFIASPTPEYKDLVALGMGKTVVRKWGPSDWRRELGMLFRSRAVRYELGAAAREAAREETIEKNSWRWWDAWTK